MTANNSGDLFWTYTKQKCYIKVLSQKFAIFPDDVLLLQSFERYFSMEKLTLFIPYIFATQLRHSFTSSVVCGIGIKLEEECNFPIIWRTKLFLFVFIVSYYWTTSLSYSMKNVYLKRYMEHYFVFMECIWWKENVFILDFDEYSSTLFYCLFTAYTYGRGPVYKWNIKQPDVAFSHSLYNNMGHVKLFLML